MVHQPRLKDIGLIGEQKYHSGVFFLDFNKKIMKMGESELKRFSDFDIFMSVMSSTQPLKQRDAAFELLSLMFPYYNLEINERTGLLFENKETNELEGIIGEAAFDDFRDIVRQIYCVNQKEQKTSNYNPKDAMAKSIVAKLEKRQEKLSKQKGEDSSNDGTDLLNRFASLLSVGLQIPLNEIIDNYTVYQLRYSVKRYLLKYKSDIIMKAKLAGAQDLDKAEDWMKPIHSL